MAKAPGPAIVFSGTLIDAERANSALNGHGIPAQVLDRQASGNVMAPVAVVVRGDQLEAARDVLVASGLLRRSPGP